MHAAVLSWIIHPSSYSRETKETRLDRQTTCLERTSFTKNNRKYISPCTMSYKSSASQNERRIQMYGLRRFQTEPEISWKYCSKRVNPKRCPDMDRIARNGRDVDAKATGELELAGRDWEREDWACNARVDAVGLVAQLQLCSCSPSSSSQWHGSRQGSEGKLDQNRIFCLAWEEKRSKRQTLASCRCPQWVHTRTVRVQCRDD